MQRATISKITKYLEIIWLSIISPNLTCFQLPWKSESDQFAYLTVARAQRAALISIGEIVQQTLQSQN